MLLLFFGKDKTAYESRISDESSDVCSSDLTKSGRPRFVYLTDEGMQLLRELCIGKRTDQLVFRNQHDRELGPSHQIRPMKETCVAAGVEPAGFHIRSEETRLNSSH